MKPEIKEFPEIDLTGLTVSTYPMGHPQHNPDVIPELWDFLNRMVAVLELDIEGPMYGASIMDGDAMSYLAGFPFVEGGPDLPSAETWLLPGGRYAVFEHVGSLEGLSVTLHEIFTDWLPKSGERMAEAPVLEMYDERFDSTSAASVMSIAVPLK
jgi:AraC family transcriptional regulator